MNGMVDFTLAGFVSDPVRVLPVKNRPEVWAKIRVCLRLPARERDGQLTPGPVRYFTVLAFGRLAAQVRDASLNVGDWVVVRVGDVKSSVWLDARTGQPRSGVDLVAESIEFDVPREQVAALTAAARGEQAPTPAGVAG